MRRFTQLYGEIDGTTRSSEKLAALERYFRDAPPEDAAWALYFLSGRRMKRLMATPPLREWAAAEAGIAPWLVDECYGATGDLAETLALLIPGAGAGAGTELPLHQVVERRVLPLRTMLPAQQRELVRATWRELDEPQRLLWHKLITGNFRVGVAARQVAKALATVAGVDPAVMADRLAGWNEPTTAAFARLLSGDEADAARKPYPFFLASPLQEPPSSLGDISDWIIESKWDGIRCQLIRRDDRVVLWSRGEELVTAQFPEIAAAGGTLPIGTVLDGEILAFEGDAPLPFALLQRRLNRKGFAPTLFDEVPIVFMAYDLLEHDGNDQREQPLALRRDRLGELLRDIHEPRLRLSPPANATTWEGLEQLHQTARQRGVEGLMLKRRDSRYGVGRTRGDWWKWKVDPFTVDAVLIHAQGGSGKRASLLTDYTFGVWDGNELVPIAKAYSGLTDEEIRRVDSFIRRNTLERFGPVRVVKPELVFELAFEGIAASGRHRSGIALRFPRMNRWREDKPPEEADSLDTLRQLLQSHGARS
jgi:DNA ligase-1